MLQQSIKSSIFFLFPQNLNFSTFCSIPNIFFSLLLLTFSCKFNVSEALVPSQIQLAFQLVLWLPTDRLFIKKLLERDKKMCTTELVTEVSFHCKGQLKTYLASQDLSWKKFLCSIYIILWHKIVNSMKFSQNCNAITYIYLKDECRIHQLLYISSVMNLFSKRCLCIPHCFPCNSLHWLRRYYSSFCSLVSQSSDEA